MATEIPMLRNNGTSADALFDGACEVAGALRSALRAMDEHGPNARDYDAGMAWTRAQAQHRARIERVRAVLHEYEEIAEGVAEQRDARRRP